jgi:hypothetical protein
MNPDNRNNLRDKDVNIELYTGWFFSDEKELLFKGETNRVISSKIDTDIVTTLNCIDGKKIKDSYTAFSFKDKINMKEIVKKLKDVLLEKAEITIKDEKKLSELLNKNYENGFSFEGTAQELADSLVKKIGGKWNVINKELVVQEIYPSFSNNFVYVLNPQTGLIGMPADLSDGKEQTTTAANKRPTGWKLKSLLNPKLTPGSWVKLESEVMNISNFFLIDKAVHTGDTNGDEWFTELEVLEK